MNDDSDAVIGGPSGAPVSIKKLRLAGAIGGHVIVEWVLTASPPSDWIAAFSEASPKRRGSPVFLLGGSGNPKVLEGGIVRWTVPNSDLSGAAAFVMESVVYANTQWTPEVRKRTVVTDCRRR